MAITSTIGPLFMGLMFDALLVGAVGMQAFTYFRYQDTDSRPLAAVVAFACFLSLLQIVFTSHANYHYLITSSADDAALLKSIWSLNVEIILTVIITFLVRLYLTVTRVWQLGGRNWLLVGCIFLFLISQLVLGIGMAVVAFIKLEFSRLPHYFALLVVQMASAAVGDFVITASLVYFLHRSRTGIPKTESMINRLIAWSVNTAAITGLVEIAILISWVTMRHTLIFVGFHLIVGQVYLLTLLAMLNHRRSMRSDLDSHTHVYTAGPSSGSVMLFRTHHLESTSDDQNHGARKPWRGRNSSVGPQSSLDVQDLPKRVIRIDNSAKPSAHDWLAPTDWEFNDAATTTTGPRSTVPSLVPHPFASSVT